VIFVSHELPSLLALADDGIFLDADSRQPIAHGSPREMLATSTQRTVHAFMRRELPGPSGPPGPPGPPA
jgi:phospholipid/cholesterol/gamma-HCH transport system ATP-binding protein